MLLRLIIAQGMQQKQDWAEGRSQARCRPNDSLVWLIPGGVLVPEWHFSAILSWTWVATTYTAHQLSLDMAILGRSILGKIALCGWGSLWMGLTAEIYLLTALPVAEVTELISPS